MAASSIGPIPAAHSGIERERFSKASVGIAVAPPVS
jgi:hypothetical protein